MNYFKLAYTTPDVLQKIKEAEKRGDFNSHIDPIDYNSCIPVDESFPYIPTGALKLRQALIRIFIISPFMWIVNRFIFRTKIYKGYENAKVWSDKHNLISNIMKNISKKITCIFKNKNEPIKDSRGMIITCNHINKLDALVVKWTLKKSGVLCGRHLKVMVADFNNQKGRLGEYMRAFGIMPFPSGHRLVRLFESAVSYYLDRGDLILVFPEQSEWWGYDRPRPLKKGAFYYAAKNNVPVLPLFITCRKPVEVDRICRRKVKAKAKRRYFDVNILDIINPPAGEISLHEKTRIMMEENSMSWKIVYSLKKIHKKC